MASRFRLGLATVIPSLLGATPLLGLAFQSDQRVYIYYYAARIDGSPAGALRKALSEVEAYLRAGNFRPLGRAIIYMEESLRFDFAISTGVPPHIVQGVVRLSMLALMALVATALLHSLYRSAFDEVSSSKQQNRRAPWKYLMSSDNRVAAFPLILASTIVVAGTHHPISLFPFFSNRYCYRPISCTHSDGIRYRHHGEREATPTRGTH